MVSQGYITRKGLERLAGLAVGEKLTIAKARLSSSSFTPEEGIELDDLGSPVRDDVPIASIQRNKNRFSAEILDNSSAIYDLYSIGLYTDDGLFFSFYVVKGEKIATKTRSEELQFTVDLIFENISQDKVEVLASEPNTNIFINSELSKILTSVAKTQEIIMREKKINGS